MKLGHSGDTLGHVRWCHSMAGDEFGRLHAFGNGPDMMVGSELLDTVLKKTRDLTETTA